MTDQPLTNLLTELATRECECCDQLEVDEVALLLLVEAIHAVEQHRERKRAEDRKAWGDAQKAIDEELGRLSGAR